mgnify:CR=1 FL=1
MRTIVRVLSLSFILFFTTSVVAETEDVDVTVGFDFTFGEIIDGYEILSGTIISSNDDVSVSWEIYNSTDFKFNWGTFDQESNDFSTQNEKSKDFLLIFGMRKHFLDIL